MSGGTVGVLDRFPRVTPEGVGVLDGNPRETPNVLDRLGRDLATAGLVESVIPVAKLLYLATVTRVFDRPVSVLVKGHSGGGKSWTVETTLKFVPDTAYVNVSAMTPTTLAYDDTPINHKHIVVYEAGGFTGKEGNLLLRTLLSEGNLVYKYTTGADKDTGKRKVETIEREGPTGLISTTTRLRLYSEDESRLLSVTIADTPEQRRDVRRVWALKAAGIETETREPDYASWHAYGKALEEGEHRVVIPYALDLDALIPNLATRFNRDWIQIIALIQACAVMHREARERDAQGRIIATPDEVTSLEVV